MELFVHRLRGLALFDLFELAGKLTALVAIIFWFLEADDRAKERHYRAWELINAARGSTGDGGRRDALQDLNKDHVSLIRAPLEHSYLPHVDLRRATLGGANLQGATLWGSNLQGAFLQNANLRDADLGGANLQRAVLFGANLQGANLGGADLGGAFLIGSNLQSATFGEPNKQYFTAQGARQYANLLGANLGGANLRDADLQEARNLTQDQLNAARGDDRTVLPAGLARLRPPGPGRV